MSQLNIIVKDPNGNVLSSLTYLHDQNGNILVDKNGHPLKNPHLPVITDKKRINAAPSNGRFGYSVELKNPALFTMDTFGYDNLSNDEIEFYMPIPGTLKVDKQYKLEKIKFKDLPDYKNQFGRKELINGSAIKEFQFKFNETEKMHTYYLLKSKEQIEINSIVNPGNTPFGITPSSLLQTIRVTIPKNTLVIGKDPKQDKNGVETISVDIKPFLNAAGLGLNNYTLPLSKFEVLKKLTVKGGLTDQQKTEFINSIISANPNAGQSPVVTTQFLHGGGSPTNQVVTTPNNQPHTNINAQTGLVNDGKPDDKPADNPETKPYNESGPKKMFGWGLFGLLALGGWFIFGSKDNDDENNKKKPKKGMQSPENETPETYKTVEL